MSKRSGRYAIWAGDFWRSPKTAAISNAAAGVYAKCVSYCADMVTDGVVPESIFNGFESSPRKRKKIVDELTTPIEHRPGEEPTPFVIKTETDLVIHNYLKRNISKAQWEQIRESDRKRKQGFSSNFRSGFRSASGSESGKNPEGFQAASQTPGHQDSLKRESGDPAPPQILGNKANKKKWVEAVALDETEKPHIRVVAEWLWAGKAATKKGNLYADPESERPHAEKLFAIGVDLRPDNPLQVLGEIFDEYWRHKWAQKKIPVLRFMVQDINKFLPGMEPPPLPGTARAPVTSDNPIAGAADRLGLENELSQARADRQFCEEQGDTAGVTRADKLIKQLTKRLGEVS